MRRMTQSHEARTLCASTAGTLGEGGASPARRPGWLCRARRRHSKASLLDRTSNQRARSGPLAADESRGTPGVRPSRSCHGMGIDDIRGNTGHVCPAASRTRTGVWQCKREGQGEAHLYSRPNVQHPNGLRDLQLGPQRNVLSKCYVLVQPGTKRNEEDDSSEEDGEGDESDVSGGSRR